MKLVITNIQVLETKTRHYNQNELKQTKFIMKDQKWGIWD